MSHPVQTVRPTKAAQDRDAVTHVASQDQYACHDAAPDHTAPDRRRPAHQGHGGHLWMMLVMCVPVVGVSGYLILFRGAGLGTLVPALLCVGMMLFMHLGMGGHGGHGGGRD
ncbi:DUF2933 domain-containing protein [Raineyella sp. W15-4]|uniref:DUF2933 domain-containing protein n=1 Tax=Raineyella sp. W15-4 TaxID=3081651 RepID=UPI002952C3DD|nr:DUF2933 domain-containing protein [Raineyella sp. W15-4]WOQ16690.1 hypothetical protein R0145_16015 [Raineyella sp. W15-4]